MSKKQKGINPDLDKAINDLLKQVMADPTASLTDRCKVIDRAMNMEKIKQKISDDEWGSGLLGDEEESS